MGVFSAFVLVSLFAGIGSSPLYNAEDETSRTDFPGTDLESRVDEMVEAILGCRNIRGLTLAVVKGNSTLLTKGYGYVDHNSTQKADEQTLFGIASLTKAFTATLLGQILKEHGHSWDTPVRDVLQEQGVDFHLYDSLRTNHVTSRDIGSHRTGIPRNNNARMQEPTREEMASKLRFFEPALPFRSSYHYNNLMYGLMTYMTEKLEDNTWEEVMTNRFFDPLGMTSTTFTHTTDLTRNDIAKPALKNDEDEWQAVSLDFHSIWGELGGSGSVVSSAVDMAKWLHMQLDGGINRQWQRVIDKDVLDETHMPNNLMPEVSYGHQYRKPGAPITFSQDSYALGWKIGSYRGLRLSVHTGTSFGYGGLIIILHDVDIALFTAITGPDEEYTGRYLLQMHIIDLLLGLEPWIDPSTACTFPEPWHPQTGYSHPRWSSGTEPPAQSPEFSLESYTGTFGNFGYGNITFIINTAGSLELNYGVIGTWELESLGQHRFRGNGRGYIWMKDLSWLEFSIDINDVIESVEIPFDTLVSPIFIRGLQMGDAPPVDEHEECQI